MENIQTQDHIEPRKGRGRLILLFLKGSKSFFIICMFCSALSGLAETVTPQIVRVTVDNIIGSTPTDTLSPFIRSLLDAFGRPDHLRRNLWIMALAVVAVSVIKAVSVYCFRVFNARGGETLVKKIGRAHV